MKIFKNKSDFYCKKEIIFIDNENIIRCDLNDEDKDIKILLLENASESLLYIENDSKMVEQILLESQNKDSNITDVLNESIDEKISKYIVDDFDILLQTNLNTSVKIIRLALKEDWRQKAYLIFLNDASNFYDYRIATYTSEFEDDFYL